MGDDETAFAGCGFKNIDVRPTEQLFVPRRTQLVAVRPKGCDDVWSHVLVCQEREVERLHAVILSVGLKVSRRNPARIQSSPDSGLW